MMLPFDYPRSPPNVRIVNRNPDYVVDPFYKSIQSKTDPSSYILNTKLEAVKNWHPSSSLVLFLSYRSMSFLKVTIYLRTNFHFQNLLLRITLEVEEMLGILSTRKKILTQTWEAA